MGFSLRGLSSHEGVGHAVLRAPLPVAGLVVALELAGAPAVVQRAVATAAALLAQLNVIVDHLVGICAVTRSSSSTGKSNHADKCRRMSTLVMWV